MKRFDWLRESARDLIALGGLPFFVLVLVRVWLLDNMEYFLQFFVAGIFFILIFLWLRQDIHSGLGLIVLIFTSLYYEDVVFSVFGVVAYLLLLGSLIYLEKGWKKIVFGVGAGILGVGISAIAVPSF